MSKHLFILLPETDAEPLSWLLQDSQKPARCEQGELALDRLAELRPLSEQQHTVMIVPGRDILFCQTALAGRSRLALQALPFQMEEQLSSPLEEVHVASGKPRQLQVELAAISHQRMQHYQRLITEAGLDLRCLCADFQLLPAASPNGIRRGERILVRGPGLGCSLSLTSFPAWWALQQDALGTLELRGELNPLPPGIAPLPDDSALLPLLAAHYQPGACVNLLQGPYQLRDRLQEKLGQLRWPALMAAVLLALYSAMLFTENLGLARHQAQLDAAIKQQYLDAFPDAKRVVNARAQMRSSLAELEQQQAGNSLLSSLAQINAEISAAGVKTLSLRYSREPAQLRLQLQARDFATLEALEARLSKKGLAPELGTLLQSGSQVSGQLTLGGE